jgi:hemerythrin-like metal-binding protein
MILELIKWDVSKSTGIEEIDNNHRKVIEVINRLSKARGEGTSTDILPEVLSDLKRYSLAHFRWEEKYMMQSRYVDGNEHREQHRRFISQLEAFEKGMAQDKTFIALRLLPFLIEWLVDHIMNEDIRYRGRYNGNS